MHLNFLFYLIISMKKKQTKKKQKNSKCMNDLVEFSNFTE